MTFSRTLDVPPALQLRLSEAFHKFGSDPEDCCYALAVRVTRFYLGDEWVNKHIVLQEPADPFMLNEMDEESENRWIHQHRVVVLGDALFKLRTSTNADVLHQRFRDRDSRPCFIEGSVAGSFIDDGFSIEIVRESGVRGNDFDFIARRDGLRLSVEVTGKDAEQLTQQTILNTLHGKRDQVPSDHPAVLFVTIPEAWTLDGAQAESTIKLATDSFFRRSKRFNAVVFLWDVIIPVGSARVFALTQRPYFHPAPRHAIDQISWLQPNHPVGDLSMLRQLAVTAPNHLQEQFSTRTDEAPTEVLRWIKSHIKTPT